MKYLEEIIKLDYSKVDAPDLGHEAKFKIFVANNDNEMPSYNPARPTVVIFPGGAYSHLSEREAEPIAMKYLAKGFNACVVYYALCPNEFPTALLEGLSAIKYIRENAAELYADPDKIYVCGFSAGGHLAASVGTLWHGKESEKYFGDVEKVKPNGLILSYPVITGGEKAHRGSFNNLLGERRKDDEKWIEYLSLENRVDEKTPRTFLWHTYEDGAVPVENSLYFISQLRKFGVEVELHIFNKGPHGIATADRETNRVDFAVRTRNWLNMSCDWILEG